MLKILVVEDNKNIRDLIVKHLEKSGYIVVAACDGREGYDVFTHQHIDLVITDIMMPHTDGLQLAKKIRYENEDIPIIILTALGSFNDKEIGFSTGVDDYLVKPFDMNELVLRVNSQLRRYKIVSKSTFSHQGLKLNHKDMVCKLEDQVVNLTVKEFQLLFKLCSSNGQIFTRTQLMDEIWGYDSESYERTVDTHIKRLREKINVDYIDFVTVRGLGYKVVLK